MKPRDYQAYAIDSIFRYFEDGGMGNPLVAMPTGTGKSIVIGGFVQRALVTYPGQRIMVLTHVKELIEQNFDKLLQLWPTAPAGVYSAGLRKRESKYPITFAGIGTVARRPDLFGHVDLLIIDEAHLVSPRSGTMYQKFIAALQETNPHLKVIGLTATHYRIGQGLLTNDGLFTDVCVDMTSLDAFNWFLDEGYLCRLVPKRTRTELDVSNVRVQRGEYNQRDLQLAVDQDEITKAALEEAITVASDRNHWLVFASGVEHAIHVSDKLNALGVSSTYIHAKLTTAERDSRIAAFKAGEYQAMVNNGILTTGFDFPSIDAIIMLRPTQSPGLWVQMLGRGTRPDYTSGYDLATTEGRLSAIASSNKQDCLVLDFAGNTMRLGPINDPTIPRQRRKGGGTAPVRVCERCNSYCHASLIACPYCEFVFPRLVKIKEEASTEDLIAETKEPVIETFPVDRIVFAKHERAGSPNSLRVTYYCGLRMFREWICFEHKGYARKLARAWWRERSNTDPPETTEDALARTAEIAAPQAIRVWVNKRYPEIMGAEFAE